jgi:hypothetical protein
VRKQWFIEDTKCLQQISLTAYLEALNKMHGRMRKMAYWATTSKAYAGKWQLIKVFTDVAGYHYLKGIYDTAEEAQAEVDVINQKVLGIGRAAAQRRVARNIKLSKAQEASHA